MPPRPRATRGRGALAGALLVAGLLVTLHAAPPAAGGAVFVATAHGSGSACTSSAPCALAEALAQAGGAGGTVELAAGTYVVARTLTLDAVAPVLVVGAARGVRLIGHVGAAGPLLAISGPGAVTLEHLSVRFAGAGALGDTGGSLLVEGATFADDGSLAGAPAGGAIDFTPSVPQSTLGVEGVTFADDTARAGAGAVAVNAGSALVEGSTFVNDAGADPGVPGAVGGVAPASLQADVLAQDGAASCGPAVNVGVAVFVAAGECGQATHVGRAALFPTGAPVLGANGGGVETVEISPVGDPAAAAVAATVASLTSAGEAFCSLPDARGVARLAAGATTCAAGALQPDPPVVTAVSPDAGRPGTAVTVTGSGLSLVSGASLEAAPLSVVASGDAQLTFTIPEGLYDAAAPLVLTSPDGETSATLHIRGPFVVETASLPAMEVGESVLVPLVANGGSGGNRWAMSVLPPGLHLAGGALIGRPSAPFSGSVTFTVTDRFGHHAARTIPLGVTAGPMVTTGALPDAEVGDHYEVGLSAAGGVPPYRWSLVQPGALPGGLTLSSRGVLAGNPATPGTTAFTLAVTDALGGVGTAQFTVTVSPPPAAPERYAVLGRLGRVLSSGSTDAQSALTRALAPYVAITADPGGPGYWVLASGGRVLGIDGAHSLGSVGPGVRAGRLVGIAADRRGTGYWVVSATGQVYGFGSAHAIAPDGANRPAAAVVAIAADPGGTGYWLLETTGRVDAYGTARALGSIPSGLHVHAAALAPALSGEGYTVLTSAGRLFAFGAATRASHPARYPVGDYVGIATAPVGIGGWLVSADGRVRAYGSARLLPGPAARLGSAAAGLAGGS